MNKLKPKYQITITNENQTILGKLQKITNKPIIEEPISFSPLSILGDLCDSRKKIIINGRASYILSTDFDLYEIGDKYEYGFGIPMYIFHDYRYAILKRTIEQHITGRVKIEKKHMDILRQMFDLHYSYASSFKQTWSLHNLLPQKIPEYTYQRFEFNISNLAEELSTCDAYEHRYVYTCYSVRDVIFSIFHYLIIHDYKFSQCEHCERYYATLNLKQRYCKRTSPISDFSHLECEQAVRNMKQKLSRRKKSVYSNLERNHPQKMHEFDIEYNKYKQKVDMRSSVNNLQALETFLAKENISNNWYSTKNATRQ